MGKKNNSEAKKGLPLRARTNHPKHLKRMGHKARAQIRHTRNRLANEARAAENARCRELGIPMPWQVRQAARRLRRAGTV